jgi:hypothetical protein
MSKKNNNPYRAGSAYAAIFAFIQNAQIVTRQAIISALPEIAKETKNGKASEHDVTVVLSPRMDGESRKDPRGNFSAQGHVYAMAKLKKVAGEDQRFRLRWLPEGQREARVRPSKAETVKQSKSKSEGTEVAQTEAAEAEATV